MRKIDINEAKSLIRNYQYAYLQMMSEHILKPVSEIGEIDWSELIEGYVFNEDSQLHIFSEDDELVAVIDDDIIGAHINDINYDLENKYGSIGKSVIVREYLMADEDGQTYVAATRLCGIE